MAGYPGSPQAPRMGGSVNAPYPQHPGAGSRGYEDEYNEPQAPPTDFDALFSGKSRPSIAVSQIMFFSPTIRRGLLYRFSDSWMSFIIIGRLIKLMKSVAGDFNNRKTITKTSIGMKYDSMNLFLL